MILQSETLIFADGGSKGTTEDLDYGAWGVHIARPSGVKEDYAAREHGVTNNMMEIKAASHGLAQINEEDRHARIIVDSAYVCNCVKDKWYLGWEKNGWKNSKNKPVANKELWEEFLIHYREAMALGIKVEFHHINSHIPESEEKEAYKKYCDRNDTYVRFETFQSYMAGNEKADNLATYAMETGETIGDIQSHSYEEGAVSTGYTKTKPEFMVTLIGLSGSGKSSIQEKLRETTNLTGALSATTRPMRPDEVDGISYDFMSNNTFLDLDSKSHWAEKIHDVENDYWYGYSEEELLGGTEEPILLVVNPVGQRQMESFCRKQEIPLLSIFLDVDWRIRMKRMIDRGDDKLEICRRMIYDDGLFSGIEDEVDVVYTVDEENQLPLEETAMEIRQLIQRKL